MAKRRLSQQQKKRIQGAQQAVSESGDYQQGLVISHQGGQVLAELESSEVITCMIKSNLGSIVCGDRITIETTALQGNRVIAILPRNNLLRRVDGFGQVRALAANISQLFVCLAAIPEPNLFLLDQYLLSAEHQGMKAIILFNKIDLEVGEEDRLRIAEIYQPLGYQIIESSVKTGQGMDLMKKLLTDNVSVFSGVSGVGKSSIIKWLLPRQTIKIASISSANEEGRHTTRTSRLYHLPEGGSLIDTPGVRGFNPLIESGLPLSHGFREIHAQAEHCRFHNCLHLNEPKCAVIAAVSDGSISPGRYQNYLKLLQQTE